jgi:putative ABC transport system ATP-binding protein
MFVLQSVVKRYSRKEKQVLAFQADGLEIRAGSFTAVVGPSGSGKTTLLSILGGMLSPTLGSVLFEGKSLYVMPVAERARLRQTKIGFVFQTFNLIPYLSAVENVEVPLSLAGRSPRDQKLRAAELLASVGLQDRLDHKPGELSVGQQQRVALARTLANEPSVILADEPTGNLDAISRDTVLAFFDQFHGRGGTIVMVTHDPGVAARAESQLYLADGVLKPVASLHRAA